MDRSTVYAPPVIITTHYGQSFVNFNQLLLILIIGLQFIILYRLSMNSMINSGAYLMRNCGCAAHGHIGGTTKSDVTLDSSSQDINATNAGNAPDSDFLGLTGWILDVINRLFLLFN